MTTSIQNWIYLETTAKTRKRISSQLKFPRYFTSVLASNFSLLKNSLITCETLHFCPKRMSTRWNGKFGYTLQFVTHLSVFLLQNLSNMSSFGEVVNQLGDKNVNIRTYDSFTLPALITLFFNQICTTQFFCRTNEIDCWSTNFPLHRIAQRIE